MSFKNFSFSKYLVRIRLLSRQNTKPLSFLTRTLQTGGLELGVCACINKYYKCLFSSQGVASLLESDRTLCIKHSWLINQHHSNVMTPNKDIFKTVQPRFYHNIWSLHHTYSKMYTLDLNKSTIKIKKGGRNILVDFFIHF